MITRVWGMRCAVGSAALLIAACDELPNVGGPTGNFLAEIPEGVLEVVAPNQNLMAVQLHETSGCYLYQHVGPVETTMLPLRTKQGRPICTRPQETSPG